MYAWRRFRCFGSASGFRLLINQLQHNGGGKVRELNGKGVWRTSGGGFRPNNTLFSQKVFGRLYKILTDHGRAQLVQPDGLAEDTCHA
jgi:hypothetical protein